MENFVAYAVVRRELLTNAMDALSKECVIWKLST